MDRSLETTDYTDHVLVNIVQNMGHNFWASNYILIVVSLTGLPVK